MEQEKFEKAVNNAKWFAVGLLVLAILIFVVTIFSSQISTLSIIIRVLQIVLLLATIKGLSNQEQYGAICGIITSILLILARDIIDIVFGVLYLIDCIRILNYMKNNK